MPKKRDEIIVKESDYITHSKEKALKLSIAEGTAQSIAINSSASFITPFALAIGGNSFHIGILSALDGILGPLGQLKGSKLLEKYSRKKLLIFSKTIMIFSWAFIISLIYLFQKSLLLKYLPFILIVIWGFIVSFFWGIGHVSWFSWMGDLIPMNEKGKYFSKRNRTIGVIGLIIFIISSFILDVFKTKGFVLGGFTSIFLTSLIFRYASIKITKRVFNPKFRVKKGYYFSFKDFIKRYDNFGKFAFFQMFFFFSVMISAPFFTVHMLENLGFSYLNFSIVSMSSTIFYLLLNPLTGKFSDKYGNVKLLYVAGFLFPLIPILWIFLKNPISLIFIPGLISGIANATFIISVTNFTYDSVSSQKRGLCIAYTSILIGIGTLTGSLIGGLLIQYLEISFMQPISFVFMISSILIIMTCLFFLPQIKEERPTERLHGLKMDLYHPFKSIHSDIIWFKNFIHQK